MGEVEKATCIDKGNMNTRRMKKLRVRIRDVYKEIQEDYKNKEDKINR